MGDKILPYVIDESIDIHHEIDLYIAKEWIKENYTDQAFYYSIEDKIKRGLYVYGV